MDSKHSRRLVCVSCGHDSYLESNYDESYIMCMYCHLEYKGGSHELLALNSQILTGKNTQVEKKIKDESKINLRESLNVN